MCMYVVLHTKDLRCDFTKNSEMTISMRVLLVFALILSAVANEEGARLIADAKLAANRGDAELADRLLVEAES